MRTILFIIQKEFLQIKRNRMMLPIIIIIPIVQLIILVHAATLEMRNIDIYIVDTDMSSVSRTITEKFNASPFFRVSDVSQSVATANTWLINNKTDMILVIPPGFEKTLVRENKADIQILINAINGTVAGIGNAYASIIIQMVNNEIIIDWYKLAALSGTGISVTERYWYNPQLIYKTYMVPGILVLLVTLIGMFLSALNLVREKEMGTIEQINVTPIKKYQFIIGKLTPFLIIALFELAFGLAIGKLLFDIPIVGSLAVVFTVAILYLFVVLAFGLIISTISNTQQQAMFIAWFFLMIFVLMSGLFTSTESMPLWAQYVNKLNPVSYFIKVIRMILLKGSGFKHIYPEIVALSIYAVLALGTAVLLYRKKTS